MPAGDAKAAGFDPQRLDRIEEHLVRSYVGPGKIAGCQTLVARHGEIAYLSSSGLADREAGTPVAEDTIWRLYSMTKPVTGVALLTLYERGLFQLSDPVHRFLPSWRNVTVRDGDRLVAPDRPPTVRDVMMHMSGIGYAPDNGDLVLEAGGNLRAPWRTLQELADGIAEAPLRFQPGTQWLYSYGMDICARLVEVLSGMDFDDYLTSVVFEPLGMVDTGFWVPEDKRSRFAALYGRDSSKELVRLAGRGYDKRPSMLNGGGGLVGTTADYFRFAQMLCNGGELNGTRILGRKTVELMRTNHLPGGGQLRDYALPGGYGEVGFDGMGFGLTVSVGLGPAAQQSVGSAGEFMWGGAASTIFWVDPVEDLVCVFMTQFMPSDTFNFRGQLKPLVYGALDDDRR
ncbi:MAG: beta-lactamase [Frankiales bacterium]|nr:beta-lactamase [Frankiales bacterium]